MAETVQTAPTPQPQVAPDSLVNPGSHVMPVPDAAPAATAPASASDDTTAALAANVAQGKTIAAKTAADLAAPAEGPPPPHARLLAMIAGLGQGLSAFGTSLATHGREGGAKEVSDIQAQESQTKLAQTAQAQAAKNAKVQQDVQAFQTNADIGNMIHNLGSVKTDMALKDTQLAAAQQEVKIGGLNLKSARNDFISKWGYAPDIASPDAVSGKVGGTAAGTPGATEFQSRYIDFAASVLPDGEKNPAVASARAALADAQKTGNTDAAVGATAGLRQAVALNTQTTDIKTKEEAAAANSPVGKLSTPEALATPGATQAIQAKINDPKTAKDDIPRLQALLPRAALAQKNVLDIDRAKKAADQAIEDGDPKAAGALLFSGLVSPKQFISSRKPEFAQAAFDEAVRLGGGTKGPDGKWSGGTWSAVAADAQFDYAANPKTQNTLNLLTTMMNPGGSIDIAQRTFGTLPGKTDIPAVNKIIDGTSTQIGGVAVPSFAAAMTSLADEYAQVLQGGAATETTLKQAKDLIKQAYAKQQGAAAFDTIRQDMAARQKGLVRDNPALLRMYPNPTGGGAVAPSGKAVSLKAAMALPINKGKTEAQVRADIAAHGHEVGE